MGRLTGEQIEDLTRAVEDTVSLFELEIIVHVATGDELFGVYVGTGLPLRQTIRPLLLQLDKDGSLARFLAELCRRKPGRPDISTLALQLVPEVAGLGLADGPDLSVQTQGAAVANAPVLAYAPGLQRNVRPHLSQIDIRIWRERMTPIETQVCRIEVGTKALGTGFLVGPRAVLTNWHVISGAIANATVAKIVCRFDYLKLTGGERQTGEVVPLAADGIIDQSPCSAAELTPNPDIPPPSPDELDYALLILDEPIGAQRGWVTLPDTAPTLDPGAALLIVQHPDAAPMKLALDTDAVIGRTAGGLRLRYHTNTEPGSSGSPCFTMDWDLIALHHLGDPAFRAPIYNQGIPAELIKARIIANGHGSFLTGG